MFDIKPYSVSDYKRAYDVIRHIMSALTTKESIACFQFVKTHLANIICDNLKDGEIVKDK